MPFYLVVHPWKHNVCLEIQKQLYPKYYFVSFGIADNSSRFGRRMKLEFSFYMMIRRVSNTDVEKKTAFFMLFCFVLYPWKHGMFWAHLSKNPKITLSKIVFCLVGNISPDEGLVVVWTSRPAVLAIYSELALFLIKFGACVCWGDRVIRPHAPLTRLAPSFHRPGPILNKKNDEYRTPKEIWIVLKEVWAKGRVARTHLTRRWMERKGEGK